MTREKIAAVALAIADISGFAQYYVKTKDDLMAAMDDALMGEALLPRLPKG